MKVYELIQALAKVPAGVDVVLVSGDKQFTPYELDYQSDTSWVNVFMVKEKT